MPDKHSVVALGGTFDHFHDGHRHFLNFAAQRGQQLRVGITNYRLTQNKPYAELIEPFVVRKKSVHHFCKRHRIQVAFSQLNDIYGPTLEDENIEALVVTEETVSGAKKINDTREAIGLKRLPVYVCELLTDENKQPLHAEAIRAGRINRQGQVYSNVFRDDIELNQQQRNFLAQPQGKLLDQPTQTEKNQFVAVVGDTSLEKFIKHKWHYDLGIYDGKCQRQKYSSPYLDKIEPGINTKNKAGLIQLQLIKDLKKTLKNKTKHLFVDGEEDLSAVALILILPLNSLIYYGQPDQGLVCITVSEQLKDTIYQLLKTK